MDKVWVLIMIEESPEVEFKKDISIINVYESKHEALIDRVYYEQKFGAHYSFTVVETEMKR